MNNLDMSPNPKNEKQVQFYDRLSPSKSAIHGQPLTKINAKSVSHVGRSNSAITQQTKISASKLRRHAKSEPISSNKESLATHPKLVDNFHQHSLTSSSSASSTGKLSVTQHQKRPNFLPLKSGVPSATAPAELPGSKISSDQSLIDENRRLRYRLIQMERREAQFTTALDRLQADYSEMNATCQKRFRIEEKKLEAMEFAMKQLTLENDKLKRELHQQSAGQQPHHVLPHDSLTAERRRESPNNSTESSWLNSNSLKNSSQPIREGDFAALDSVNILLNALRERDSELKMLKMLLPTQLQKQVADYVVSPGQATAYGGNSSSFAEIGGSKDSLSHCDYPISGVITPPADFSPHGVTTTTTTTQPHEYK